MNPKIITPTARNVNRTRCDENKTKENKQKTIASNMRRR